MEKLSQLVEATLGSLSMPTKSTSQGHTAPAGSAPIDAGLPQAPRGGAVGARAPP